MYTPRGGGVSELGDIEVVPRGDELHLFHLTLPNHDVVQHAVSRDGLSWTPLPAALRTGDPGAVDDDQIWTMSVAPRPAGDGYVMLYTALSTRDEGRVQRVAAATSPDLVHWEKSSANPVGQADPRWYETEPGPAPAVSWRDPKVTRVGDRYLATICAREANGPVPRRGCVGLMSSDDLEHWEVAPPLFAPHRYWDLECPQLFMTQSRALDTWYVTAAIMEDRSQRYWIADSALGPFRSPPGGDLLAPPGHYAARITSWRDLDLLFAWHQPKLADGWMTSSRTVDWVEARNPFGKFLAPPLVITDRGDKSLALASFPGWDAFRADEWRSPQTDSQTLFRGRPVEPGSIWELVSDGGMDVLTAMAATDDFLAEGVLRLNGARGGLALRQDGEGNGLYIEFAPWSRTMSLQRWGVARGAFNCSQRHDFGELQRVEMARPVAREAPLPFRLLSVGPYIELSLAGEVAIATMTGASGEGHWGIWIQDGSMGASDVRWAPLRHPEPGIAAAMDERQENGGH